MSEIGKKLRAARKQRGQTQEELAEVAKLNLRTVQRIETGQSEPRGKTLQLLCGALDINAEDILDHGKQENNDYLVYLHLSVLSFLVIPVGNIILPLIIWLTHKDKVIGLREAGANLLNFQITWTIFTTLAIVAFAVMRILHYAFHEVPLYLWITLYGLNVLLPLIFAFQAKKGKREKRYPTLLHLVK